MSFAADLRYELANESDITDLVETRIYPVIDRGKEVPSMVYNISGGMVPPGFKSTEIPREWSVQVDFYTKDYANVPTIRETMEDLFNRFRGTIGENDTTTVYRSYVEDVFEVALSDDDDIFRIGFTITFQTD